LRLSVGDAERRRGLRGEAPGDLLPLLLLDEREREERVDVDGVARARDEEAEVRRDDDADLVGSV
jgi:hypothetical protein